jgi:hypothetical protein
VSALPEMLALAGLSIERRTAVMPDAANHAHQRRLSSGLDGR